MQLIIAVLIIALVYGIQYRLYRKMWDEKLDIKVEFRDSYMNVGDYNCLEEQISNAKFLPLPVLHVKFATSRSFDFLEKENASVTDKYHRNDVFSVMGNQRITRKLDFVANKRGFYTISGLNVIAKDFFMTRTFAKSIPEYSEMYVFPQKFNQKSFVNLSNWMMGEIETKKSLYEDPFYFGGIREYNNNDNIKKINWRATAKSGTLMVNQYNKSSEFRVKLLVNFDTNSMIRSEYIREVSIGLASSSASTLLKNKVPVMVETNGLDIVHKNLSKVDYGSSMDHMVTIDKYLSRIDGFAKIDSFFEILDRDIKSKEDNISYVIISPYYKDDLLLKLDYMVKKGINIIMIVPYYDRYGFVPVRPYMRGWEVNFDES